MSEGRRQTLRGQVRLNVVSVSHGARQVVPSLTLNIEAGEFVCLLGPSGCGKTTILRAIAGLKAIDEGTIHIDGVLANTLHAHRRNIAMVFQDLALFPHMSVESNIAFGLKLRRVADAEMRDRIAAMVALLHLEGLEKRLPRELSGGQQQRVAIARSLVISPSVLLLDEPFAALDRKLREEMRREFRALQRQLGITVVFVTHDQEEALTMADKVVVINQGRVEQAGAPTGIYESPVSRFVLDFVGTTNFLCIDALERSGDKLHCRLAGVPLVLGKNIVTGGQAGAPPQMALRPEHISLLDTSGAQVPATISGMIAEIAYEGAMVTYQVILPDQQTLTVRESNIAGLHGRRSIGDKVALRWDEANTLLVTSADWVLQTGVADVRARNADD